MNIELNEKAIADAIDTAVTKAVINGVGSWDIQHSISEAAATVVQGAEIPRRVGEKLAEVLDGEMDAMIATVVQETLPAMKVAMLFSTRQMAARMLYGLRTGPSQWAGDADKAIWLECVAQVEKGSVGGGVE